MPASSLTWNNTTRLLRRLATQALRPSRGTRLRPFSQHHEVRRKAEAMIRPDRDVVGQVHRDSGVSTSFVNNQAHLLSNVTPFQLIDLPRLEHFRLGAGLQLVEAERVAREIDIDNLVHGEFHQGRRCERTIVDMTKLFDHLRAVASEGYALDFEECEEGLVCAAAPVFGPSGEILAALSISGPAYRLGGERTHREIAPHLIAAAGRLADLRTGEQTLEEMFIRLVEGKEETYPPGPPP